MTDGTPSKPPAPTRRHYVAIPRDPGSDPAYDHLSRDAQWLLIHLETDPYRLKSGVFVLNERLIAKAAKATTAEVSAWVDELIAAKWLMYDDETGEGWLVQHMAWDNTMKQVNHAKSALNDVRRIRSERISRHVQAIVFAAYPDWNDGEIDPGWTEPESPPDGIPDAIRDGIGDGIQDAKPDGNPDTRSPKPVARNPRPDPPEPEARDPRPAPGTRDPGGDGCERCGDKGILEAKGGGVDFCICETGRAERTSFNRSQLKLVEDAS